MEIPQDEAVRTTRILQHIGIPTSSYYHQSPPDHEAKQRGPKRREIPQAIIDRVDKPAEAYAFWGYKRAAVIARREGTIVSNKKVHRIYKLHNLLHRRKPQSARLREAARLFELLPQENNLKLNR